MSTVIEAPPTQDEILEIKNRLRVLEEELEEKCRKDGTPNWRASMRRMQEGWASLSPELQAEFSEALDEAIARARAVRVDDD